MPETEIKELTAVSSKRRSLGQLKLKLERQITAVETLCRMIDPRGDGSLRRSTEQSHNDLNKEHKTLQSAWDNYVARIDDLTMTDLSDSQKPKEEYQQKLENSRKDYSAALELIFVTSQNAFPNAAANAASTGNANTGNRQGLSQNYERQGGYVRLDFHDLKPSVLDLDTSEGNFRIWKKKFRSYYLSANLATADIDTQQNFFISFLGNNLLQQIENQITEDLPVYGETDVSHSCMKLIESQIHSRNPLPIGRLKMFQTRHFSGQTCTNFLNLLQKRAEFCDLQNFDTSQILSFIFLANTIDMETVDEVLEQSADLTFEGIYKIAEKIELSRNLKNELPQNKRQTVFKTHTMKVDRYRRGHQRRQRNRNRSISKGRG